MSDIETIKNTIANLALGQRLSFKLKPGSIVPKDVREQFFNGQTQVSFEGARHADGSSLFSVFLATYQVVVKLSDIDLESFKVHSRTVLMAVELISDFSDEELKRRMVGVGRVLSIADKDNL